MSAAIPRGPLERLRGRPVVLAVGVPVGLYLASRLLQVALIVTMAGDAANPMPLADRLVMWDGGWFARIATQGYEHSYTYDRLGHLVGNGLAFFPGYPALVALLHAAGTPATTAALAVSWTCGAVATVLVARLGTALYDLRTGLVLAVLFCAQPLSVALAMGYSESLFAALAFGALLLAYRRRWWAAGAVGLAAALTRPTGLAVAVALLVAAALAVRREKAGLGALAGTGIALLGVPAYLAWVALRVGDPLAWFRIQGAGWGTRFDAGWATGGFILDSLAHSTEWVAVSTALMLLVASVAAGVAVVRGVWAPLCAYGLLALALVVAQGGYYHSKMRLLVPVLLVLVPAAVAIGRARRVGTVVLSLCCYAAFGLWYGAYMVTVWPYTI